MKKWLPFGITLLTATAAAAGVYFWKGSEIEDLTKARPATGVRASGLGGTGPVKSAKTMRQKLAEGPPTRNGLRALFGRSTRIMAMDREEVEKLLLELEKSGRIRSPLAGIDIMSAFARLAELDPAAAMERAMKSKGEMRDIGMFATMNEWLTKDRKGALAWFTASGDEEAKRKYLTFTSMGLAGSDPQLISDLSMAIQDPEARKKAMMESLGALAFSDPDAALKRLNEIEDPEEREKAGEMVYQGFLFRHPEKALAYSLTQPAGSKARDNIRQSLVQWGEQDPGAALKWMTSQNKDVRQELFDTQDKNPGWAFGKATTDQINEAALQLGDQAQKDKLRAAYANAQGNNDPAAGLEQLSSIKDKELQSATAASIGSAAARAYKVNEMNVWLESAPPNNTRDTVVASFAAGLAQRDPVAGLEWAGKITDGTIRAQTIQAVNAIKPAQPK